MRLSEKSTQVASPEWVVPSHDPRPLSVKWMVSPDSATAYEVVSRAKNVSLYRPPCAAIDVAKVLIAVGFFAPIP